MSGRNSDKAISTFNELSLACSRFSTLLQRRSHYLLPRVHLQFSGEDLKKVDKYNRKIKVGVRKIVKHFGEFCGASLFISKVIKDKKWKSAWLLLEPEKHSMYCIRNFYLKSVKSGATNPIVIVDPNNNNYNDNTASISNKE